MFIVTDKKNTTPFLVGMKAWNLLRLSRHFTVPDFAVVTTRAFRVYQNTARIPRDLDRALRRTLGVFLEKGTVIIRSSGVAEDLPGVSFAGMYETTLDVRSVDQGVKAIKRVWRSTDTARVRAYCREKKITPGEMAVIIQHQLDPEVSGVMFTRSPSASVREAVLIECCPGMGEKLVSGMITPTRYTLYKNSVHRQEGDDILTKPQLDVLKKTGKKIEKMFDRPQDIEWAFENGTLYILQSRPVSVVQEQKHTGTVYCNANVRETIPDPVSPMGYSIFDTIFFPNIIIDTFGFPINRDQYKRFRPVERVRGRFYWNVNNTAAYGRAISPILELMEGDKSIDPQLAEAFESIDPRKLPEPVPSGKMVIFTFTAMFRLTYFLINSFIRFRNAARKVQDIFKDINVIAEKLRTTDDFAEGVRNTKQWLTVIGGKISKRYFGGVVLSIAYLVLLGRILSLRLGTRGEVLARMTTVGLIDKTGEMVLAIRSLATLARRTLKRVTSQEIARLYDANTEFRSAVEKFMHEFGHRGPAEFDIASITWREDYSRVFQLIATSHGSDIVTERTAAIKELTAGLRPMERFFVRLFMPRIEALTPLREDGKHHIFKIMAKVKDQLLVLEKQLRDREFLRNRRDIFFLTLQDLEELCEHKLTADALKLRVRDRKKEWNAFLHAEVPDIIYADGTYLTAPLSTAGSLVGTSVSFGVVTGRARILRDFKDNHRLRPGDILVTHHTDPGWTPLFSVASGVIIEVGGVICHAAMVARELGIPALVLRGAMTVIDDGQMIELDANEGRVRFL
jgi:phosphohistidine swiveling domain-containing protein